MFHWSRTSRLWSKQKNEDAQPSTSATRSNPISNDENHPIIRVSASRIHRRGAVTAAEPWLPWEGPTRIEWPAQQQKKEKKRRPRGGKKGRLKEGWRDQQQSHIQEREPAACPWSSDQEGERGRELGFRWLWYHVEWERSPPNTNVITRNYKL